MSLGWKKFTFFDKEEISEHTIPDDISCSCSSTSHLFVGTSGGEVRTRLCMQGQIRPYACNTHNKFSSVLGLEKVNQFRSLKISGMSMECGRPISQLQPLGGNVVLPLRKLLKQTCQHMMKMIQESFDFSSDRYAACPWFAAKSCRATQMEAI